jgi:c-di-GMP-binding flagellar brake protein YcgR
MLNFNDGLPAIIQPDHETIKSRDRTQYSRVQIESHRKWGILSEESPISGILCDLYF